MFVGYSFREACRNCGQGPVRIKHSLNSEHFNSENQNWRCYACGFESAVIKLNVDPDQVKRKVPKTLDEAANKFIQIKPLGRLTSGYFILTCAVCGREEKIDANYNGEISIDGDCEGVFVGMYCRKCGNEIELEY